MVTDNHVPSLPNYPLWDQERRLRRRSAPCGSAVLALPGRAEPATLRAALAGRARSRPVRPGGVPDRCATAAGAIEDESRPLAAGQANRMGGHGATLRSAGVLCAIPSTSTRATTPGQGAGPRRSPFGRRSPLTRRGRAGARSTGWHTGPPLKGNKIPPWAVRLGD
jgi:hypothetical protein